MCRASSSGAGEFVATRHAHASCIGTAAGGTLHVGAAALGLSALLVKSAFAFAVVKYVGRIPAFGRHARDPTSVCFEKGVRSGR